MPIHREWCPISEFRSPELVTLDGVYGLAAKNGVTLENCPPEGVEFVLGGKIA